MLLCNRACLQRAILVGLTWENNLRTEQRQVLAAIYDVFDYAYRISASVLPLPLLCELFPVSCQMIRSSGDRYVFLRLLADLVIFTTRQCQYLQKII